MVYLTTHSTHFIYGYMASDIWSTLYDLQQGLVPASARSSQCSTTGVTKAMACGMMHMREPLLLVGKSSQYGGSGFSLSSSEWSFTIRLMPYSRK